MKTILLKKQVYLFLFFFLLLASCSRRVYYYSGDTYFWQRAAEHHIVAVMPAEMVYTGTQPKDLTPEDIKVIEERKALLLNNHCIQAS